MEYFQSHLSERIEGLVEIENLLTEFLEVVDKVKNETKKKISRVKKSQIKLRETKEHWVEQVQKFGEDQEKTQKEMENEVKKVEEMWVRKEKEEREKSIKYMKTMKETMETLMICLEPKEKEKEKENKKEKEKTQRKKVSGIWEGCSIPLTKKDLNFLNQWLFESGFSVDLNKPKKLFQASVDGFSSESFHFNCDNKGKTLVLVEAESGELFGGFSNVEWDSIPHWKSDPEKKSFLFSFDDRKKFPMSQKSPNNSIFCHYLNGPSFGKGNGWGINHSLFISNNCNLNHESYIDSRPGNTYENSSFSFSSSYFKVLEYEVWSIT